MTKAVFALIWILFSFPCWAEDPYRLIAIMENERLLSAEPNIRLVQFFSSHDSRIRARAVLAAARTGNKKTLLNLGSLIHDRSLEVRKYVAFALGQIRSKEGLPLAFKMLKDPDPEVRRLSVEAIGRIGSMETSERLLPFLDDENIAIREQTALSFALIKDKTAVQRLMEKAAIDDPAQWSYVYALYRLADERALPVLHQVLAKPSASPSTAEPSSILFVLKALWTMKKPLTSEEADRLLRHSDERVQQNALEVLAVSSDPKFCKTISSSYGSMSVLTKWKAIDAMGSLGCAEQIDQAFKEQNPTLQGSALAAYAKIKKDDAIDLLRKAAKHNSWIVRWRVAQALSEIKDSSDLLQELMSDPDPSVKLDALDSLTHFLPQTAGLFEPLLKSSDFAVRAIAAGALGKTKDPKYLKLLIDSYMSSTDASEIEGRVANLDVLAEFSASSVLPIYEKALHDPEFTIRRHAIDGLKKLVGSQFYWQDRIQDPEDFLFSNEKVSQSMMNKYPSDYGSPVPELYADMVLDKGTIGIHLLGKDAPIHVLNFKKLAERGFYNGLRIHRVVPNFVIQGGDPTGTGWGGAGEIIHDQMNLQVYRRGMVGMPLAGKDTGGSQFFITHSRQPHLDGNYTIFGEVISGMDVVDKTEIGDRILKVIMK